MRYYVLIVADGEVDVQLYKVSGDGVTSVLGMSISTKDTNLHKDTAHRNSMMSIRQKFGASSFERACYAANLPEGVKELYSVGGPVAKPGATDDVVALYHAPTSGIA